MNVNKSAYSIIRHLSWRTYHSFRSNPRSTRTEHSATKSSHLPTYFDPEEGIWRGGGTKGYFAKQWHIHAARITLLPLIVLVLIFWPSSDQLWATQLCVNAVQTLSYFVRTVHDMENLTFSEEFCGCSADSCAERRGSSAQVPWIFRAGGRGFRAGRHGFRLKMAETRRRTSCATTLKDRETRRNDRSNYHYRNRIYLDMKYE